MSDAEPKSLREPTQAAAPPGTPRRLFQAGHRELAHHAHRGEGVPRRPVEQPLVRSGVRSPARSAIVQPLHFGRPLTSALTYLPACSHGSVRVKHGLSRHSSSLRFRAPRRAPILEAAAAADFVVVTHCMIARRLPHAEPRDTPILRLPPGHSPNGCCRTTSPDLRLSREEIPCP
jgi:hypothetical protein